jgi:hypothetical protein
MLSIYSGLNVGDGVPLDICLPVYRIGMVETLSP